MRVTIGTMLSIQWGKRLEGIESDWQVDFGEDNISCLISSKDADLNDEILVAIYQVQKTNLYKLTAGFLNEVLILSLNKELYKLIGWMYYRTNLLRWVWSMQYFIYGMPERFRI